MGVILDDSAQQEIDQLEAKGAFSLADQFRHANEVSLSALAFMPFVPAKYQTLVANSANSQTIKMQHDEKARQEEKEQKDHAALVAYQQQIDSNMLRFSVDGQDIQISQGDLRKVMQHRAEELEEQKKALLKNGGDPKQVRRIDNLLSEYQPVIDDLQNHKADASTMNTVHDLMKQDPPLSQEVKASSGMAAKLSQNEAPSRQAIVVQHFDDSTTNAPLKTTFAQNAAPVVASQPAAAPLPLEQRQQNLKDARASLGF